MTNVIVADDHGLFRSGLVRLLENHPRISVVAEAEDGEEAIAKVQQFQPHVAVIDVKMPKVDGMKALQAIKRLDADIGVILLSGYLDPELVYEGIQNGAGAYLLKTASFKAVEHAIEVVREGGVVLPPEIQDHLATGIRARGADKLLTSREYEILKMVSDGAKAPDIGDTLHIEPATVKSHLRNIYRKLEVADRAQAVKEAMRRGILE
jgi:two-component system nitrate/nitrite response regulator NarL